MHVTTVRVARLNHAIDATLSGWSRYRVVQELQSLRGISQLHAAILTTELGPFERLALPRQLIGYLGLVPSESSIGGKRRQSNITETGNTFARKALVEAACQYRSRSHEHHPRGTPRHLLG